MSEQIWATNVSDVRTNAPFRRAKHYGQQEHRDAITESSLGRNVDPELIADQYNFTGATKLSDNLPLPPVISLAHRCVTAPFKAVIQQIDIGETVFRKTILCDFEGQPLPLEPYWAIVIQEPRETADWAKGIEEGWMNRERCKGPAVKGWRVCRFHGAGGGHSAGKDHPSGQHTSQLEKSFGFHNFRTVVTK